MSLVSATSIEHLTLIWCQQTNSLAQYLLLLLLLFRYGCTDTHLFLIASSVRIYWLPRQGRSCGGPGSGNLTDPEGPQIRIVHFFENDFYQYSVLNVQFFKIQFKNKIRRINPDCTCVWILSYFWGPKTTDMSPPPPLARLVLRDPHIYPYPVTPLCQDDPVLVWCGNTLWCC